MDRMGGGAEGRRSSVAEVVRSFLLLRERAFGPGWL